MQIKLIIVIITIAVVSSLALLQEEKPVKQQQEKQVALQQEKTDKKSADGNNWIKTVGQYISSGKCDQAVRLLTELGDKKKTWAYGMLGDLYEKGRCVPRDLSRAYALFELEGLNGIPDIQLRLGMMDMKGQGVPRNEYRAHRRLRSGILWYSRGDPKITPVMIKGVLGTDSVPDEIKRELAWLEETKQADISVRIKWIKKMLLGDGVPKNLELAAYWMSIVPEEGLAKDKNIHDIYLAQMKLSKDGSASATFMSSLKDAAGKGDKTAQSKLAHVYAGLQPAIEHFREALIWSTLADIPTDRAFREDMTKLLDQRDLLIVEKEVQARRKMYP